MLEGRAWDEVSPEGKELLLSLLSQDPTKRPTATEVLFVLSKILLCTVKLIKILVLRTSYLKLRT